MDIGVLVGCTALGMALWSAVGGAVALLAGRMIHERDAHDRPVVAGDIRH